MVDQVGCCFVRGFIASVIEGLVEVHGEILVAVRVGSLVEHQVETAVGCLGGRGGGVEEATGEDVQRQVGRLRRISGGSAGIVEKVRCWRGGQDVWAVEEGCSWGDHGRAGGHGRRRLAGGWLVAGSRDREAGPSICTWSNASLPV